MPIKFHVADAEALPPTLLDHLQKHPVSLLQPSSFEYKDGLEDWSARRSNLDRHLLALIERREVLGQIAQRSCSFDLGRLLIGRIEAVCVGIEVLAVSNVEVVPGHHGAPSAGGSARGLSATDAHGWLTPVMPDNMG
jgi:hypothetical protein